MSLDARIRKIAEEAVAASGSGAGGGASVVGSAELEKQVADQQVQLKDLHDHLHRALAQLGQLAARVETLETTPAEPDASPRRTGSRRKSTES